MKGLILGTDLLEHNNDVKVIEINTNAGILNRAINLLDVTPFFEKLIELEIKELHFIFSQNYGTQNYNIDIVETKDHNKFTLLLKEKCEEHNIEFHTYPVKNHSVTIPYIEDSDDIFILRQAYDSTAIIDELYCADKYGFTDLMSGSDYVAKTYTPSVNDFVNLNQYENFPNVVVKSRHPAYDTDIYPELYVLNDVSELNDLKNNLQEDCLIQEFVYDEKNIVENRHSVIRSIDILYGNELGSINIGVYKTTSLVDIDFTQNEFIYNTKKLNKKSRFKYINKRLGGNLIVYHADDTSLILKGDKSTTTVNELNLGETLYSIDFEDKNGISPSSKEFRKVVYDNLWDSTIENDISTLKSLDTTLETIETKVYDTLFIKIKLLNGEYWNESLTTEYYIEDSNTKKTNWKYVNELKLGDRLVVFDIETEILSSIEITELEVVFDTLQIYSIDVEPSDIFLVDVGQSKMAVMHNIDCFNCDSEGLNCGLFGCEFGCPQCEQAKY
jgi:hypothetical protein